MFLYSLGWHLVLCSLLVSELNHQNKNQHKMLCCDKQDVQDTPTKSGTPAKEGARPFKGLGRDTFTALQVMLVERGLMTTRFFCYFPFLLPLQSKLTTMWSTLASIWPWTGAMFLHLFSVLLKDKELSSHESHIVPNDEVRIFCAITSVSVGSCFAFNMPALFLFLLSSKNCNPPLVGLPFLKILDLEGTLARSYFELMCVGAIGQNWGGAQRWPSVLGAWTISLQCCFSWKPGKSFELLLEFSSQLL